MITAEKWEKLHERMEKMQILEGDLDEHFIRGSGSGGQKINKTSSCVQLNHAPSGIEIRCQKTRSQADNPSGALKQLCKPIKHLGGGKKRANQPAIQKIRRKKRRRSRRAKAKMLDEKSKQGAKKKLRGRIQPDD